MPKRTVDLRPVAFGPDEDHSAVERYLLARAALQLDADGIVWAVTSSSASIGGKPVPRRRFQRGRLVVRGKNPVWVGVFWDDRQQADGAIKRVRRTVMLGSVSELGQRRDGKPPRAALKAFQPHLDAVNREAQRLGSKRGVTLAAFVEEWRLTEAVKLKGSTVRAAESHLRTYILPKLGHLPLIGINQKAVDQFVAYLVGVKRKGSKLSRKTIENVLGALSSILRKAREWDHSCGTFKLPENLPDDVRKEQRCFTDEEVSRIIAAAREPFATIVAVAAVLGLRIGEVLALRVSDLDFARKIIRIRQSVDAATRTIQAVKSRASSADLPMPSQLEQRLRAHIERHKSESGLLFLNRKGRPFSANNLREKQLHPLLDKLGIPRGGFHSLRHGAASSLLADGATPIVVQRQLRHSDPRVTLGIYGHVVDDQQRQAVEKRSGRIAKYVN